MNPIFIGQIMLWCGQWIPEGFWPCDGRVLKIQEYPALFSIVRSYYGGDGQSTFNLPDFSGITLAGIGASDAGLPGFSLPGTILGTESEILITDQMPAHTHTADINGQAAISVNLLASSDPAISSDPTGLIPAAGYSDSADGLEIDLYTENSPSTTTLYNSLALDVSVSASEVSLSIAGAAAAHNNMQPYLSMYYIIAVAGDYPELETN